jgi:hypothetical protein
MDTLTRRSPHTLLTLLVAGLLTATLLVASASPSLADGDGSSVTVLAAEERERRPIAPTQRDQLGLVLYGFMALIVVGGAATLRRQLKGERPQSDGEFRWR